MNDGFAPRTFFDIQPNPAGTPIDFYADAPEAAVAAPEAAATDIEAVFTDGMQYEGEDGSAAAAEPVSNDAPVAEGFSAPEAAAPSDDQEMTASQDAAAPEASDADLAQQLASAISEAAPAAEEASIEAPAPEESAEEAPVISSDETPEAAVASDQQPAEQGDAAFVSTNDTLKHEWGIDSVSKAEIDSKTQEVSQSYAEVNKERAAVDEELKQLPLNPEATDVYECVKQFISGLPIDNIDAFKPEAALATAYGADSAELREWIDIQNNPGTTLGDLHNKYLNAVRIVLHRTIDVPLETKVMAKFLKDGGFAQQDLTLVA